MADSSQLINPFVGLRAFEEDEDYLFFGRDAEINDLLKKFGGSRFLAVIGSSGSGKSSLVKSGLLPAIYSGFLSPGTNWRVALFRPGNDPIGNLSNELAREGVLYKNVASAEIPYQPFIDATLRRSSGGLVQSYRQAHLPATENLLIVIDQFEELFRFSKYEREAHEGRSDALGFVNLLLSAAQQQESPVYILITMRSDFLGDCAEFRGLPEAINAGQYLVPRMTRDEIREAITGPVAVGGAQIAPRLVTRLLNDVGNNLDQLPILQHAMMRTWDSWRKKKKPALPIDIDDYEKIGMMSTALSQHAEEIYAELTSERQQQICELMFKSLTDKAADVRGIRRPTSIEDLCELTNANQTEVIPIVEIFRKAGRTFLMPPPSVPLSKKSIIDISHESLMRVWQRLSKWADDEAASADNYLRLSEDALRYRQGVGALWRDPDLAIGLKWYETNKPTAKWAERYNSDFESSIKFLNESKENALREKRNRQRLTAAVAIALVVIALGSLVGFIIVRSERNRAVTAEKKAVERDSITKIALSETQKAKTSDSISKLRADSNAQIAYIAKRQDSLSAIKADLARRDAENARDAERSAKDKANALLATTLIQNRQIAAAEYQKRIREGPTDEDLIKDSLFNEKLLAYVRHLDTLKKWVKVNERDDELYEKLYYCWKTQKHKSYSIKDSVFKLPDQFYLGKNCRAYSSSDRLSVIVSKSDGSKVTANSFDFRIADINVDTIDQRIFVSTEDNAINIYHYNDQYLRNNDTSSSLPLEAKIPMGGLVTAMDYCGDSLIFFGLKTGEIGYIKYKSNKHRKYQPVYRNELDSRITALDFFIRNKLCYLLATSIKGMAVVYELGPEKKSASAFMNTDVKLTEVSLPENHGEIINAGYYVMTDSNHVALITTKRSFLWNPFVGDLRMKLEQEVGDEKIKAQFKDNKLYQ